MYSCKYLRRLKTCVAISFQVSCVLGSLSSVAAHPTPPFCSLNSCLAVASLYCVSLFVLAGLFLFFLLPRCCFLTTQLAFNFLTLARFAFAPLSVRTSCCSTSSVASKSHLKATAVRTFILYLCFPTRIPVKRSISYGDFWF